ncbi:hypothetical protein FRC11_003057 [Ceratobasidium sp. 423]|nr:hypothetical protein FRC11_003057 [Ceratobasidium sp. 423]
MTTTEPHRPNQQVVEKMQKELGDKEMPVIAESPKDYFYNKLEEVNLDALEEAELPVVGGVITPSPAPEKKTPSTPPKPSPPKPGIFTPPPKATSAGPSSLIQPSTPLKKEDKGETKPSVTPAPP